MDLITSPLNDSLHNHHSVNSSKYFGLGFVVYPPPRTVPDTVLHSNAYQKKSSSILNHLLQLRCYSSYICIIRFILRMRLLYIRISLPANSVGCCISASLIFRDDSTGYCRLHCYRGLGYVSLLGWTFFPPLVYGLARGF